MGAALAALLEGLGAIFAKIFTKVAPEAVDSMVDLLMSVLLRGHFKNMIMLVGESGAGKTTLVRYLTSNLKADPTISTTEFRLYTKKYNLSDIKENGKEENINLKISIGDYRGQNINTLIDGLRKAKGDKAFQKINTLVMIVDIFKPLKNNHDQYEDEMCKKSSPDINRIKDNIKKWNIHTIELLMAHLNSDALTGVCLFINKADLLDSDEGRKITLEAYQPLIDNLRRWTRRLDDDLVVILGSVKTGEGFNTLEERIIKNSVQAGGSV